MTKLIALKHSLTDIVLSSTSQKNFFSQVKQHALLFDQIGYLKLDFFVNSLKSRFSKQGLEFPDAEYEWLKENEIIFDPMTHPIFNLRQDNLNKDEQLISLIEKTKEFEGLKKERESIESTEGSAEYLVNLFNVVNDQHSIILRLVARKIDVTGSASAVTMLPYSNYTYETPNSSKNDCMQIVINKLPIPDELTPWEQIIDYKNDEANQKNLLAFRRWISLPYKRTKSNRQVRQSRQENLENLAYLASWR